ncbi:hypothetical protein [Megalodesulfovibrio gigas]|uniref:Glycerophosphoryl diester phosphodiesterase membrane domain-containing protein n=1 Tax=Megalodesulfovibrio gigas (strain ATCC 19364 / DSM 1382 / NCIMB 9332 / VKM B-1759) TaxID=1121448 RepID=T2GD66_MEGG1|nr:hypothetical protein [Megalodesulfovibrio gigas]AGW14099.1 hypothetical protein DGI_2346 [Megalodesulfovibrio gigas DSM 1382 = ATCC 19364]
MTAPFTLRPLGLSGVLDHAVRLFVRTFADCLVTVLAVSGPFYVINTLLDRAAAAGMLTESTAAVWNILIFLCYFFLLVPLQQGIITPLLAAEYLGEPITRSQAFRLAQARFWRLVWARTLRYTLVLAGLPVFLVLGIWLYVRYFFVEEVVILEDSSPVRSLGRSGQLSRHAVWMILLTSTVFLTGSIAAFIHLESMRDPMLRMSLEVALSVLLVPAELAVNCVLYFSARCRREGFAAQTAALREAG